MTLRRRTSCLVAATLVAAAGLVGLGVGPATAAACTTSGITAVVDYNDGAGGGTQSSCDATTSATNAAKVFGQVGVKMTRNPDGSVCQVNGKPADAKCGRLGNQYWSLWWSDGTSGKWVYSQSGVDGLEVPKNGSVAWAWQGASGRRQPAVAAPVVHPAPTPKPTPKPSPKPKPARPTKAPTSQHSVAATGTSAASGTTTPTAGPATKAAATTSRTATPTPSTSVSASVAPPTSSESPTPDTAAVQPKTQLTSSTTDAGGLPLWVPGAVVVVLLAATGGVLWWRRASGGGPGPT